MLYTAIKMADHEHTVYARGDKLECSKNNGHSHDVGIGEDGMPYLFEVQQGSKIHTHPVEEGIDKIDFEITKDKNRINEVVDLFRHAFAAEEVSRKKALEALEFYEGDQWPEDVRKKMNEEQRAVLTVNLVASMIDLLSGYARRNKTDFRYKPVEEGDSKMADILFIVVKQIMTKMGYFAEEIEVFEELIKTGRGCFHVYMDFDEDIRGQLKVEYFPSENVVFGPHLKKDASDCDYLVKWEWKSMAELKAMFPDEAEDLKYVDNIVFQSSDNIVTGYLGDSPLDYSYMHHEDMVDVAKKKTRILECEQREYRTVFTFIDPESDFIFKADDIAQSKVKDLKSMESFIAVRRTTFRLRETVVAGGVLLEDRYVENRPYKHYSVLPVYCYKQKNNYWGKIEFGKDPQRELNKRRSQLMDVMNRMGGSGWFTDDQTFDDHIQESEFKRNAPRAGWVQKVADVDRPPQRQDPPPIPQGIMAADQMSIQAFREVTHVSPELLGNRGRAESGVALARKQNQGILGNEFIFDNFSHTKILLGKIIARYVQEFYRERIARILISADDLEAMKIGGETASAYTLEMIDRLVHESEAMDYDVIVAESQFSESARDANLAILAMLAQSGMPIPPEFLLMFVDVAEKDKLLHAFQQQAEREDAQERRKYDTEIQKTQIAKGGRPTETTDRSM